MKREEFLGYYVGGSRKNLSRKKLYKFIWEPQMVYSSDGVYYETIDDVGEKAWVYYTQIEKLDRKRDRKIKEILEK